MKMPTLLALAMSAFVTLVGVMAHADQKAPDFSPPTVSRQKDLERKILANLLTDDELKRDHIDVTVDGTSVTLKGKIGSEPERARAVRLAQVEGVSVVHDQLVVGSRDLQEAVTDTAVTTDLKARFLADDVLRHATISVSTNNGVVTLEGVVPSAASRAKVLDLAHHARGVVRVEDHLKVAGS
ncbi:MAG: transport-associated protein [Myxococcales bacterium]|nr:transport-associated protein [Myxococcales bacterium]